MGCPALQIMPRFRFAVVLVSTGVLAAAAADSHGAEPLVDESAVRKDLLAIQQKFDFGAWAAHETAVAEEKGEQLKEEAVDKSSQASSAIRNTTSSFTDNLSSEAKRSAFSAVLVYLGKCPEFYKAIPKVPTVMAPKLAEAFQGYDKDPSQDDAFCAEAANKAIESAIDENLPETTTLQEKTAVKWIAMDRSQKICNAGLMKTLKIMEEIRKKHPEPYKEGVKNKLLLDVLTGESLKKELDELCMSQQASRLYSDSGNVEGTRVEAELTKRWPLHWHLALGAAAAMLSGLSLRAVVAGCRRRDHIALSTGVEHHLFD